MLVLSVGLLGGAVSANAQFNNGLPRHFLHLRLPQEFHVLVLQTDQLTLLYPAERQLIPMFGATLQFLKILPVWQWADTV